MRDNNACDVLLRQLGGLRRVAAYVHRPFGVYVTARHMHARWASQYDNWSYPSAQVAPLASLYRRQALSAASTELLWQLLLDITAGAHRLKGLLPAGTPVAHRTGTSATNTAGLSPATNDVGVIQRRLRSP